MSKPENHTVIVGAGVVGVCCAYFLAKRGAQVTVLERDDIGKGASYGNAGIIAPGHAPINKPGRVKQALKSLFNPLSPLYLAPRLDPAVAVWLWRFSQTCTERHLEFCMRVLGPLGHATSALFDQLVDHEQMKCNYRRDGYYEIYLTERGLRLAQREASLIRQYGYHPESLFGDELRQREPAINDEVVGGVYHPEAATLNPYHFVCELAERTRSHGAQFQTGREVVEIVTGKSKVHGVQTSDGETIESDAVVVATGAYSKRLIRRLGLRFPLQPAKGYHRDRRLADGKTPLLQHACVLGENLVFCTPMEGFVRFAGTLEFSGVNHKIRRRRLEQLTTAAKRYLNGMGDAEPLSDWCGLRPCMPDGLPVLGPVTRYRGLYIATGHAMMGLTLGPITGKLVAEYVLDGTPSIDVAALHPERF